jgi:MYXO-CTERM domain-containing protein
MKFTGYLRVRRLFAFAAVLATVLVLAAGHQAQAQTLVDPNSRVSAVPGFAGTGLQGYYYSNANGEIPNFDAAINQSIGPLSGYSPLATFLTTNVCYPGCYMYLDDSQGGLAAFLNGNATDIVFADPMATPRSTFNNSGLILNGYIAINTPGSYNFSLSSDDGSILRLGDYTGGGNDLLFTAAGLYQIAINFTEDGGGSNLTLTATSDSNQSCFLGCSDGNGGLLANGLFYSDGQLQGAPAPTIGGGASSLALLGLLGVGALTRRRRRGEVL